MCTWRDWIWNTMGWTFHEFK